MDDNANYCDSLFADLWKIILIDPRNSFPFGRISLSAWCNKSSPLLLFLFLKWKITVLYAVL